MATGYTRQSAANIINAAIIFAVDLNNEFNAVVSAFDAVTGHNHDSTTGGGAPIPAAGLNAAQDWSAAGTNNPKTFTIQDGNKFSIKNQADNTKIAQFSFAALSTATTRTYTFPDVTDTIVTLTATQTLTNKTLTSPVITGATITVLDNAWTMQNAADATKQLKFSLAGLSTATTRTITIPDVSDTLVALAATQTLTNKTLTTPTISSGGTLSGTFTFTGSTLNNGTLSGSTISGNPTITVQANKLSVVDQSDATKIAQFSCASLTTATTRTYTLPDVTDTIVTLTATQTLTNKTLTTPTINSPSINTPTISNPSINSGGTLSGTFTGGTINASAVTSTVTPIPISSGGTGATTLAGANIVTNTGTSSTGNAAQFADGTGKVITDSGVPTAIWTTGDVKITIKTTADTGWVIMNDGTIGDATSGATTRANADTSALFTLIWNNIADAQAPVVGGRGANAAADFAAHKKITLPLVLGRALAASGSGSGLTARVLGFTTGAETHSISVAEMPAHAHPGSTFTATNSLSALEGSSVTPSFLGQTAGNSGAVDATYTPTGSVSVASQGSGTAMSLMPPISFFNIMIKL